MKYYSLFQIKIIVLLEVIFFKKEREEMYMESRKKLRFSETITIGLLLFGLFFGAGNVIFPVKMGQMSGSEFIMASIGFIITAAGIPVLGIISSALSKKDGLKEYAMPLGNFFAMFFTLALYLTIGPFFAIPRTATVAFEVGLGPYVGENVRLPLFIYSLIFFFLVWFFARKPNRIMDVVGKVMTPLFILLIGILIVSVFVSPAAKPMDFEPDGVYATQPLFQGILDGYNTMDALAALAFAIVINSNIKKLGIKEPKHMAIETIKASIITVLLFAIIYGGLVYLGAASRTITGMDDNGGVILARVSEHHFGRVGQILLAITISVACLKTAIGLVVSIGDTFASLFPKTTYKFWMYVFIIVSFSIANFGLNAIIQWSIPVLMFLFPIAVVLIGLWILRSMIPFSDAVFKTTIFFTAIIAIFDFIKSLPHGISEAPFASGLLSFADRFIPWYGLGIGWILPSLIGLIIGLLFFRNSSGELAHKQ